MPRFVKAFRCGSGRGANPEKGEPCNQYKWSKDPNETEPCNSRKYRANWHPGWKWHAFMGHLLTLFYTEIIEDALQAIRVQGSDPAALLQTLQKEENRDYQKFIDLGKDFTPSVDSSLTAATDLDMGVIYQKPNYCHSAKLPAEIRYKGILTDSSLVDTNGTLTNFDMGSASELPIFNQTDSEMKLKYDVQFRQPKCTKYRVNQDFPDYFLIHPFQETKLELPNAGEIKEYGNPKRLVGYVAICPAGCGWNCAPNNPAVGGKGFQLQLGGETKNVNIRVNGVAATNYTAWDGCAILQRADGSHTFPANAQNKYEIAAQGVNTPAMTETFRKRNATTNKELPLCWKYTCTLLKISSIILW